jgi:predicted MPP superfamily phosphohydrolase
MTVAELMEALAQLPSDLPVVIVWDNTSWQCREVTFVDAPEVREVRELALESPEDAGAPDTRLVVIKA